MTDKHWPLQEIKTQYGEWITNVRNTKLITTVLKFKQNHR